MPPDDLDGLADIVVLTVKSSLAPVLERLAAAEQSTRDLQARVLELASLRDRVVTVETKAAIPGQSGMPGERGPEGPEGKPGRDGRDGLPGVPGAAGDKGLDGRHGKDGLDGKDGVGIDDFEELFDGERTWTHRYLRGGKVVKEYVWQTSTEIYRGVYIEGKTYDRGDRVTWAGSEWHANETTNTKPGDGSKAWTLTVKRGRDGKDGRDGRDAALPVGRPA
jgi:hypothetical protein